MVSEKIKDIRGQISGVTLSSFLQMIEMEQKTCTIKVFTKNNVGHIFFLNGTLIESKTVNSRHLDALYDILSWDNIVIEVEKNTTRKRDVINLPLMHILMESAKHSDELDKSKNQNISEKIKSTSTKKIQPKIVENQDFCLEIGIKLLIDFDDYPVSFRSKLVGVEHGKYLLLKAPSPFGKSEADLFKVEDLIVKSLYKGTIYAFRTKLLGIISKPSKLMFIEYPKRIEHHELRSHKRFKCSIVAQTEVDEKERGGVIENISLGGCLCVMETFETDQNLTTCLLNNTLPLRCHFPGSKGETSFIGEIKNARMKSDEIAVGVEFLYQNTSDEARGVINTYIQLIESSGEYV